VRELTRILGARYDAGTMDNAAAADHAEAAPRGHGVTCPTYRTTTVWQGNPHRPFCSLTCRLVDLGVWLDEGYRVPARRRHDVP
jgi:endogenous inhibitor of DNA gyrase (YacG/DUF329 family)